MTAPSVDAETLAAYFHPLLPETWDDPVVGPVLRRLAETAPEVIAAVADVDRALRRPIDVDGATRGGGDASSRVHRGHAGGEVAMVGADAGQQMLLALLDAGVEFIVVGGTAAVMMGAPVVHAHRCRLFDSLLAEIVNESSIVSRGRAIASDPFPQALRCRRK